MTEVFKKIDLESWPMVQTFYYYTKMAPTTFSVNVDLDVTTLRGVLKERGIKFFPAYLYVVSRVVARLEPFRVAKKDRQLGHWKVLNPAYPQFHEDNQTTSLLWTLYHEDFKVFYRSYLKDTKR